MEVIIEIEAIYLVMIKFSDFLFEDVNIKDLSSASLGLYVFLQSLNKVGSSAPIPIPIIDIIPNYKIERNPGNFSFSRSSFKIEFNPKAEVVDFTGAGHDLFHAITVGMAKKFARQRPKKDVRQKAFLSPEEKASKFNLQKIVKGDGQERKKSHYQKAVRFDKDGGDATRPLHPQAEKKYKGFKTLNLQQVLPQYDLEEDFGNKIVVMIDYYIKKSKPIDLNDVNSLLDDLSQIGISHDLTQDFAERYREFLIMLFSTYNSMLEKFKKVLNK